MRNVQGSCPAGYTASVCYVITVLLLYNVQSDIEQPFDQQGVWLPPAWHDALFRLVHTLESCTPAGLFPCCPLPVCATHASAPHLSLPFPASEHPQSPLLPAAPLP
jgi:hypothetical protein